MQLSQLIWRVGRNDAKLIGRDTFLIGMFAYSLFLAILTRFALPWVAVEVAARGALPFSLEDWYPLIVAGSTFFGGSLFAGMIFGFMLLDEKDAHTLTALLVSPMPINYYVLYRVGIPTVIAFMLIVLQMWIINIAVPPVLPLLLLAAGGALFAPIIALFLATFAQNKVQGFALTKFTGIMGITLVAGWFLPEAAQIALVLFPPYWVNKAYWLLLEGNAFWLGALAFGIAGQMGVIWLMVQRFNWVAYRS